MSVRSLAARICSRRDKLLLGRRAVDIQPHSHKTKGWFVCVLCCVVRRQVQSGEYDSSALGYSEAEQSVCPPRLQVLCVPVIGFGGKAVGVLQAARRVESPPFNREDEALLGVRNSQHPPCLPLTP